MLENNTDNLTIDLILATSPTDFLSWAKGNTLGYNSNLRNILKMQYSQCEVIKNAILTLRTKGCMSEEDVEKFDTLLKDLYISMQLIEDRFNILNMIIKSKEMVEVAQTLEI